MNQEKLFRERLRSANERVSSPRLLIFQTLLRHSPVTVPALVSMLRENAVDASTTYRNINLFRRLRIINDIAAGGQRMIEMSDDYGDHHHHFTCHNCNTIVDFDDTEIENSLSAAAKNMGVQLTSHHIEMTGLCSKCKA